MTPTRKAVTMPTVPALADLPDVRCAALDLLDLLDRRATVAQPDNDAEVTAALDTAWRHIALACIAVAEVTPAANTN